MDRRLAKHLTLRTGYVHRFTKNEPIITPKLSTNGEGFVVSRVEASRATMSSRYSRFMTIGAFIIGTFLMYGPEHRAA